MMIDFSSEAIKERQWNYLFKMPCALNKKKKIKKEKKKSINQESGILKNCQEPKCKWQQLQINKIWEN